MNTMPSVKEMQRACGRKDPSYDGIFFLGVRTTGIFCRPSCPARKPLPQNVNYFSNVREALFAGYRPCKRCRPMDTSGRPPEWVGRALALVNGNEERVKDSALRASGIDPFRVRRYFQKHYGMTFQAWCRERRMGGALDQLRQGASLDDVTFGNGYESHSGFRDAFSRTFGRPPGTTQGAGLHRRLLAGEPSWPSRGSRKRSRHMPSGVHRSANAGNAIPYIEEGLLLRDRPG